jgi:hemoglobin
VDKLGIVVTDPRSQLEETMSASAHDHRERDLDSPEEIAEMVRRFYQDVAQDDLLGPMFNDVAQVDWAEHLPKLAAFWCRALLGLPGYQGNPFRAHTLVHAQEPFTPAHFQRWLELFTDTIELGWSGPNCNRALTLAHNVARVHSNQLLGTSVETSTAPDEVVSATIGRRSGAVAP